MTKRRYEARHNPELSRGHRGSADAAEYQVWDNVDESWHGRAFHELDDAREFATELNRPDNIAPIYSR